MSTDPLFEALAKHILSGNSLSAQDVDRMITEHRGGPFAQAAQFNDMEKNVEEQSMESASMSQDPSIAAATNAKDPLNAETPAGDGHIEVSTMSSKKAPESIAETSNTSTA
ncbi:uncharacterized protein RHO25_003353 [Cercospora beticola]|uniref:Uncharacterized protein n=1 Tax=Cercospora beticola TaxID=122368 RepID=A0ABZ0NGT6_CERBT|nr:hypothetical protein RHO25_003353 [Cercospora beticola]CAK1360014.1 unnamed protein product [Cercospora beticola]